MSTRISAEFPAAERGAPTARQLYLVPSPQLGSATRAESAAPRYSFGWSALRPAPAPSFLTSVLPIALMCTAFGYLAYVCLMGWSGVQWL